MRRLLVALSFVLPAQAAAYELTGASWRMSAYPGGVPYCPVTNATDAVTTAQKTAFGGALDGAMLAWTDVGAPAAGIPGIPCSAYRSQKTTCTGSPSATDQQNWLYWEADWSSVPGVGPSTIGVTPWWSSGGEILTAKVLFNDRDFTWSTDGSATDVGSIAVHELGHFVGLAHYDETDPAKATACGNASPPSVMCSFYTDGVMRIPTTDDILAVCYLYPVAGALGSACSAGGTCTSGLCHADGYCTQACPPSCPLGYTCTTHQCVRDQAPPTCKACATLPCGAGSVCVGTSGPAICTDDCTQHSDCPLGFLCADMQSGGGVCWPLGNRCDAIGPDPGQACVGQDECAFGNICLQMPGGGTQCFGACRVRADCADPTATCLMVETGIGYCDKGAAVCACDTGDGCQTGCPCDVGCDCACNATSKCDAGCACDLDCTACACDTTAGCDAGCQRCDPDCACACDVSAECDPGCEACDPECGGCNCGTLLPNSGWLALIDAAVLVGAGLAFFVGRRSRRRLTP
jgi:hypothetical protein